MYIVYNLVTQVLRGSIQCESKPGQGLRCMIIFPIQRISTIPQTESRQT
jgi:signal transduction histidine kinase